MADVPIGSRAATPGALTLPALAASLLPKTVCPLCSPAYTAMLSALGLPFIGTTTYLLPVMLICLTVALGSLAMPANGRGRGPFWLGFVAAVAVVVGRFALDSASTTYAGLGLLVVASIWNAIPKRGTDSCPACLAGESAARHAEGL